MMNLVLRSERSERLEGRDAAVHRLSPSFETRLSALLRMRID
jgi:hypothetical protein